MNFEWNPIKWPLSCIAGIIVIILFFIFIPIAVALFPTFNILFYPNRIEIMGSYDLTTNFLSDLGNYFYNPIGAIFFNIGLILIGIALLPFFFGISKFWEENTHQNTLKYTRIIGFASAFSLMMIGAFSENAPILHEIWSFVFFILILVIMGLASYALLDDDNFMKITSIYGFGAITFNLFFLLTGSPFLEWITVLTALGYVAFLLFDAFKMEIS